MTPSKPARSDAMLASWLNPKQNSPKPSTSSKESLIKQMPYVEESKEQLVIPNAPNMLQSKLNRCMNQFSMSVNDIVVRKKSLQEVQLILVEIEKKHELSQDETINHTIFGSLKPLLRCWADISESTRSLSIKCAASIFSFISKEYLNDVLSLVLPLLLFRLNRYDITDIFTGSPQPGAECKRSAQNDTEEVEELRFDLLFIIVKLIARVSESDEEKTEESLLRPYLPDFVTLLAQCTVDSYIPVKLMSTTAVADIVSRYPSLRQATVPFTRMCMHMLVHKHAKVRQSGISVIGSLVLHGASECIQELTAYREHNVINVASIYHGETRINYLATLVADEHISVRRAVYTALASWCTEMNERTDYETLTIPLLLNALSDSHTDVHVIALDALKKLGAEYEKDRFDELTTTKSYGLAAEKEIRAAILSVPFLPIPNFPVRPPLGQRLFVRRFVDRLIHAVITELSDWKGSVQNQSLCLLRILLFHGEEHCVSFCADITQALFKTFRHLASSKENNAIISENEKSCYELVLDCAMLVGRYMPSTLLLECVLQISDLHNASSFQLLAKMLSTMPPMTSQEALEMTLEYLDTSSIYQTLDSKLIDATFHLYDSMTIISKEEPLLQELIIQHKDDFIRKMQSWVISLPDSQQHFLLLKLQQHIN